MIEVSSYEAKTHLAELLKKVAKGERVLITKHNVPVAVVIPAPLQKQRSVKETVEAIKHFREENTLQGLQIKKMIEEGRR
jgi:prevent-host-death family protein